MGVIEVSDQQTRFVPITDRKRFAGAVLAGIGLGMLLGWRRAALEPGRHKSEAMTSTPTKARSLTDEFLPTHDFGASYEIRINATRALVYQCLIRSDFNKPSLVRLLMTIRTGKRPPRNRVPSDLRQRLQGTGFVILDEVPGEELVIGVAGRFWRPDGGRCLGLTAGDFGGFSRPGYAKVAWIFRLRTESPKCTALSTETRIKCFGPAALWKFSIYWSLVGPFSGLIRKAILKQVKTEAESVLREAS